MTSVSDPALRASASVSSSTPRPSSATVTSTMPPRCSARSSSRPRAGLPAPLALLRRLDPVGDRVAQQVYERLREPLEDRPVELGLGPYDDELDLLAGLGGEVAHGARQRRDDRRERQRPHPDRRALEPVEQARADVELVGDAAAARRRRSSSRARAPGAGGAGRSRRRGRAACRSSRPARGSSGARPAASARRIPAPARGPRPRRAGHLRGGELRDQRRGRLAVAFDVPAQGICRAQQGFDERRRQLRPRRARRPAGPPRRARAR